MVPYSDDTVIPLRCGIQFVGIVCFIAFKLSTLKEIAPQSRGENVSAFALPSQRFSDKKKKTAAMPSGGHYRTLVFTFIRKLVLQQQ